MLNTMTTYIDTSTGLINSHFIENSQNEGTLLYWQNVNGDHIQVREHGNLRWLLINNTLQSIIDVNNPRTLLFPHLQYLAAQWQTLPPPNNVLELGLGGGAIRNYLLKQHPQVNITSVEKNAGILACYSQFFASSSNESLLCDDAQVVLTSARNIDWVILDLFCQIDAPRFLFERAFYEKIHAALNTTGKLFINFLSQHNSQLKQLQKLLFDVFGYTVYPHKISGYVNHIVVISKQHPKQIS